MPSLLPTLTVLENVELCWLLSKKHEAGAHAAASEVLEKLGLSAIVDKLPGELSGGQNATRGCRSRCGLPAAVDSG